MGVFSIHYKVIYMSICIKILLKTTIAAVRGSCFAEIFWKLIRIPFSVSIFASWNQLTASSPQVQYFMHVFNSRSQGILFFIYLLPQIPATLNSFSALTLTSYSWHKLRFLLLLWHLLICLAYPTSLTRLAPQDTVPPIAQGSSPCLVHPWLLMGSRTLILVQTPEAITRSSNYFCNLPLSHTSKHFWQTGWQQTIIAASFPKLNLVPQTLEK